MKPYGKKPHDISLHCPCCCKKGNDEYRGLKKRARREGKLDLADLAMLRMKRAGRIPPGERFDKMVKDGLIDKDGKLGKKFHE